MTRHGGAPRVRLALATMVAAAVVLSPAGTPPAGAAKKPRPTTTTSTTTSTTTTTSTSTTTTVPPSATTSTTSTTVPPPPPPTVTNASTYHINASHTGAQALDPLTPNLQLRWRANLGGAVSYPVVAEGKVFVTVGNAGSYGTKLYALDLETGAVAWGPEDLGGTYRWSAAAYDEGSVYALNFDGILRAYDAATGLQRWIVDLPGRYAFTSPPTAWKGMVYVGGAGSGGTLYYVDGETGAVWWTTPVTNGDNSSPVVTETDVYVSYSCPNVFAFDRATGAQRWRYGSGCSGGGGKTAALGPDGLYVRDSGGDIVLDPETGTLLDTFSAGPIPALDATTGYFLNGSTLEGHDLASGDVLWSFSGDGRLTSAPVTANGHVYVGSASGNVYALRASTGEVVTTVNVGSAIAAPDEQNVSQPLTGMAIAHAHLLVPGTNTLSAYAGPSQL